MKKNLRSIKTKQGNVVVELKLEPEKSTTPTKYNMAKGGDQGQGQGQGQTTTATVETLSKPAKLATSFIIWYCTFTLGLSISFIGSSLIEFSSKFNVEISTISKVLSVYTFSFLFGAFFWGNVFNYINRQLTCVFLMCCMGAGIISLPLMPSLSLFFGIAALTGFTTGGYDTAQIVWMIEMWGAAAEPYIQTQHFSFALGTLVSPLIMRRFLSDGDEAVVLLPETNELAPASNYNSSYFEEEERQSNISTTTPLYMTFTVQPQEGVASTNINTVLYVPFLIGGLAYILGGVLLLVMYIIKPYVKPPKVSNLSSAPSSSASLKSNTNQSCDSTRILLILFSALILASYSGMETCTIQFLPSFSRFIELSLSGPEGALVLSGLTGAFTAGRAIGIIIIFQVPPEALLFFNITTSLIGNSILYFFANDSYLALWIGVITLGIGFSTVFPSYYGFIKKHLKVSNVVGAIMIVGGGLLSSMYPIIIGEFIIQNPFVLMYTNYFSLGSVIACFGGIYCVIRRRRRNMGRNGEMGGEEGNLDEEEEQGERLNLNSGLPLRHSSFRRSVEGKCPLEELMKKKLYSIK